MKKVVLIIGCFLPTILWAQALFISEGKIIFEKKIDLRKEWGNQPKYKNIMDKIPRYHTSQHVLYFSEGKTLYEKGDDISEINPNYTDSRSDEDIIYSDLQKGLFVKKQAVFEETMIVSDSIRNIQWEMTNDTRMIAGFECHKATAIVLDSIFVVAFYTDQVTVSGGPLSFCRLPGMILGIAIPRMNLTIFATKIVVTPIPQIQFSSTASTNQKFNYNGFCQFISLLAKKRFFEDEGRRYVIKALL
jgi:GLPGLI family protein